MTGSSIPRSKSDVEQRWDLGALVEQLGAARDNWRRQHGRNHELDDREFPSPHRVDTLLCDLRGALFPLRLGPAELKREGENSFVGYALDRALNGLVEESRLELATRHRSCYDDSDADRQEAQRRIAVFAKKLPALRELLDGDVEAAFSGDPAARDPDEVLLCYPGILALIHHRLAHELYRLELPLLARMVAELAHSRTGIDIHPGATIGHHFFIDHGTGVVIGETAEIGDRVRIYQAVTLGAKSFETTEAGELVKGQPRHPIVGDDVVIYAGATILGRITIGEGSSIGGNVWLTHDVPPHSLVTQARTQQDERRSE